MTDERLAEIEHQSTFEYGESDAYELCDELLQALKAERDRIEVLEHEVAMWRKHVPELEATIKRVKEVRHEMDYADPKSRNHWKSQLDKALQEQKWT